MEVRFGPEIITNLEKVGVTFDEAWQIVRSDLILRKMLLFRVNSKAVRQVAPRDIREAYEKNAKEYVHLKKWRYQVVTIRGEEEKEIADRSYQLLREGVLLDELKGTVEKEREEPLRLHVSEEYDHDENAVSTAYKDILVQLKIEEYSEPIAQKSRVDSSTVYRIFYLKEFTPGGVVPLQQVEGKIKEKLIGQAIDRETEAYLKRLRHYYDVRESYLAEMIPDDFQPFVLR